MNYMSLLTQSLRPVCNGGVALPYISFGDCGQFIGNPNTSSSSSYKIYENVTQDFVGGICQAPVDGDSTIPCSCSVSSSQLQSNCWITASGSGSYYTASVCQPVASGWKSVRVKKVHHGSFPYSSCPGDCGDAPTRYLRCYRSVTGGMSQKNADNAFGPVPDTVYTLNWVREYLVDKNSGNITTLQCIDDWMLVSGPAQPMPLVYSLIGMGFACGQAGFAGFNQPTGSNTCPFVDLWALGGIGLNGWILTSANLSSTSFGYGMSSPGDQVLCGTAWRGGISFNGYLSDGYSISDVQADCVTLANTWDMSSDLLLPWRTDDTCTITVEVKRDEAPSPINPESGIEIWGNCGTLNGGTYTGAILGAPLPIGYGLLGSGSANTQLGYYSFLIPYDRGGITGQWNSDFFPMIPPWATYWTDFNELHPSPYTKGAFSYIFSDGVYHMQKFVAIQDIVPSINYARPCGADRAFYPNATPICGWIKLITSSLAEGTVTVTLSQPAPYLTNGDVVDFINAAEFGNSGDYGKVVTVIDSTHFTYAGAQPFSASNYVRSHGAPNQAWNTNASLGNFVYLSWLTNICDNSYVFQCTQSCNALSNPCAPPSMAMLPAGSVEKFNNIFTMPNPDHKHQWQGIPVGNILDPLWVAEMGPADYVEAECSVPVGAPPFTSSAVLPCWLLPPTYQCGQPATADCYTYGESAEFGI